MNERTHDRLFAGCGIAFVVLTSPARYRHAGRKDAQPHHLEHTGAGRSTRSRNL